MAPSPHSCVLYPWWCCTAFTLGCSPEGHPCTGGWPTCGAPPPGTTPTPVTSSANGGLPAAASSAGLSPGSIPTVSPVTPAPSAAPLRTTSPVVSIESQDPAATSGAQATATQASAAGAVPTINPGASGYLQKATSTNLGLVVGLPIALLALLILTAWLLWRRHQTSLAGQHSSGAPADGNGAKNLGHGIGAASLAGGSAATLGGMSTLGGASEMRQVSPLGANAGVAHLGSSPGLASHLSSSGPGPSSLSSNDHHAASALAAGALGAAALAAHGLSSSPKSSRDLSTSAPSTSSPAGGSYLHGISPNSASDIPSYIPGGASPAPASALSSSDNGVAAPKHISSSTSSLASTSPLGKSSRGPSLSSLEEAGAVAGGLAGLAYSSSVETFARSSMERKRARPISVSSHSSRYLPGVGLARRGTLHTTDEVVTVIDESSGHVLDKKTVTVTQYDGDMTALDPHSAQIEIAGGEIAHVGETVTVEYADNGSGQDDGDDSEGSGPTVKTTLKDVDGGVFSEVVSVHSAASRKGPSTPPLETDRRLGRSESSRSGSDSSTPGSPQTPSRESEFGAPASLPAIAAAAEAEQGHHETSAAPVTPQEESVPVKADSQEAASHVDPEIANSSVEQAPFESIPVPPESASVTPPEAQPVVEEPEASIVEPQTTSSEHLAPAAAVAASAGLAASRDRSQSIASSSSDATLVRTVGSHETLVSPRLHSTELRPAPATSFSPAPGALPSYPPDAPYKSTASAVNPSTARVSALTNRFSTVPEEDETPDLSAYHAPAPTSHVCVHPYHAIRPDEMQMQVGDLVGIEREYGDGWARGQNITHGRRRGLFPLNILTPIKSGPSQRVAKVGGRSWLGRSGTLGHGEVRRGSVIAPRRDESLPGLERKATGASVRAPAERGSSTGDQEDEEDEHEPEVLHQHTETSTDPDGTRTDTTRTVTRPNPDSHETNLLTKVVRTASTREGGVLTKRVSTSITEAPGARAGIEY